MDTSAKILKHTLSPDRVQVLSLPRGSQPLSAQVQPTGGGSVRVVLWTLSLVGQPTVPRRVVLLGTGQEISAAILDQCDHVATLQWLVARDGLGGTVSPKAVVEHVWIEREPATAAIN